MIITVHGMESLKFLVLLLVFLPAVGAGRGGKGETTKEKDFGDFKLRLVETDAVNWNKARTECQKDGWELTRISNSQELSDVTSWIQRDSWIGLKPDCNKPLTWNDGTQVTDEQKKFITINLWTDCHDKCCYLSHSTPTKIICSSKKCGDKLGSYICTDRIGTGKCNGSCAGKKDKMVQDVVSEIKSLNLSSDEAITEACNLTGSMISTMKKDKTRTTTSSFMQAAQAMEEFGIEFASQRNLTVVGRITSSRPNIVMQVARVSKEAYSFPDKSSSGGMSHVTTKDRILLPEKIFENEGRTVTAVLYDKVSEVVSSSGEIVDGENLSHGKLNSKLLSASIVPKINGELPEDIQVQFTHDTVVQNGESICVFWNFSISTLEQNGTWSRKGCRVLSTNETHTTCVCNHLTNFAVLMQTRDVQVAEAHRTALEVITYVGISLSLFGELVTIFVYLILMDYKTDQAQIRLNLVGSIAVAQIFFLVGIDATANQGVCMFVAVTIHYFYLVAFGWMLTEGIYLYAMVVLVFNTDMKIKVYYILAWGAPALVVAASLTVTGTADGITAYLHDDFCWLSFKSKMIWAFAAPVFLISVGNLFVLTRVLYEMLHLKTHTDATNNYRKAVKACTILFPLLGSTWLFGLLSISTNSLVFQYLFTITNAFQGFFIFLFHCARSTEVRALYNKKKERWNISKSLGPTPSTTRGTKTTSRGSPELPLKSSRNRVSPEM